MKSILALAIVLLSNIAISCTSNQKIYEEFISTNISLPFSRMEQIGGDSIWNKDSELTHIVSIDSIQCASCLANKIVLWHEFEKEIRQYNRKYNICFILSGDNNSSHTIFKRIRRFQGGESPMYIDRNDELIKSNPIIQSLPAFKSFIINDKMQVIAFGDPIVNKTVKKHMIEVVSAYYSAK